MFHTSVCMYVYVAGLLTAENFGLVQRSGLGLEKSIFMGSSLVQVQQLFKFMVQVRVQIQLRHF